MIIRVWKPRAERQTGYAQRLKYLCLVPDAGTAWNLPVYAVSSKPFSKIVLYLDSMKFIEMFFFCPCDFSIGFTVKRNKY